MRGLHEFEIDGVKRGMLLNFTAFGILEENLGIPFDEIIARLSSKTGKKVALLHDFFYAGAVNYSNFKGQDVDYTRHHVGSWITELGIELITQWLTEALVVVTPKNSVPLP